jgi:hypothetical protein
VEHSKAYRVESRKEAEVSHSRFRGRGDRQTRQEDKDLRKRASEGLWV